MKQPTLEEVKEYFKNADLVQSSHTKWKSNIKIETIRTDRALDNNYVCDSNHECGITTLYSSKYGYAKILTYKEKTFSITESQIKEIYETSESHFPVWVKDRMKEWFPEAFESEVKSLPNDYTGWIIDKENPNVIAYSEKGFFKYGFDHESDWKEDTNVKLIGSEREATEQEVFEALKKEAVKRGYKEKDVITDIYYSGWCALNANSFEYNRKCLWLGDCVLFKDGKWAEKTITLSEAEQQLGKKIIV